MKTLLYFLAILTFGFPGKLNAQEKNQSPLKPINKVNYDKNTEVKTNTKSEGSVFSPGQSTPEVNKRIDLIDRQIAELEKLKSSLIESEPVAKKSGKVNNVSQKFQLMKIEQYFTLKEEAESLNQKYTALRNKASNTQQENAKLKLLGEANELFKVYEIKQIKASNALAQINLEKFSENKTTIKTMLIDYKGGAIYVKMVNKLTDDADYAMRMAIEIREEANAQPNNSAILGNYSNAEEKEAVALNKQEEAITILHKTAYFMILDLQKGYALNYSAMGK